MNRFTSASCPVSFVAASAVSGGAPSKASGALLGTLAQRLPAPSGGVGLPAGYNVHLFPDGEFSAVDGRPGNIKGSKTKVWRLDADLADLLIAAVQARQTALVIDYEHQSLDSGKPAGGVPAAGWLEDLAYFSGVGLVARVTWTSRAKAYIEADEYRYISPAFHFDRESGAITALVNAALTNTPGLDGLCPVAAALLTDKEETTMDNLLAQLRAMLGLAADADEAVIGAALAKLAEGVTALACKNLSEVLALKAHPPATPNQGEADSVPDPAKYVPVAAVAKLQDTIAALTSKIDELATQSRQDDTGRKIAAALADGRLDKTLEDWAHTLGKSNPEALEAYLSARQPVAALAGKMQTGGSQPPADSTTLNAEDSYVIEQLGIAPEAYLAARKGEGK